MSRPKGIKGICKKLYTVYNNKTDLPVIVDGEAEECARAMGIRMSSFYATVSRAKSGQLKKWYVESISLDEEMVF